MLFTVSLLSLCDAILVRNFHVQFKVINFLKIFAVICIKEASDITEWSVAAGSFEIKRLC